MKIRVFSLTDVPDAVRIWNEEITINKMIYAPMTVQKFISTFIQRPEYSEEYMLSAVNEAGDLLGFISGMIKRDYLQGENFINTPGYVTFLIVSEQNKRKGIGSQLLVELESRFKAVGKKRLSATYRNPIMLEWVIPCSRGAMHNNAPGVPAGSSASSLFFSNGYTSIRTEHGLYLNLKGYDFPEKVRAKEKELLENGIEVTFYEKFTHYGFDGFFDALHGEVWRKTIMQNNAKEHPLPILIAAVDGKIIGFAGPIDKENTGRGWFNGIATHPDYERRGIASVLFCRLLQEFKNIGARYSTIFTDHDNPALGLYKKVGFQMVKDFLVMEKEI